MKKLFLLITAMMLFLAVGVMGVITVNDPAADKANVVSTGQRIGGTYTVTVFGGNTSTQIWNVTLYYNTTGSNVYGRGTASAVTGNSTLTSNRCFNSSKSGNNTGLRCGWATSTDALGSTSPNGSLYGIRARVGYRAHGARSIQNISINQRIRIDNAVPSITVYPASNFYLATSIDYRYGLEYNGTMNFTLDSNENITSGCSISIAGLTLTPTNNGDDQIWRVGTGNNYLTAGAYTYTVSGCQDFASTGNTMTSTSRSLNIDDHKMSYNPAVQQKIAESLQPAQKIPGWLWIVAIAVVVWIIKANSSKRR